MSRKTPMAAKRLGIAPRTALIRLCTSPLRRLFALVRHRTSPLQHPIAPLRRQPQRRLPILQRRLRIALQTPTQPSQRPRRRPFPPTPLRRPRGPASSGAGDLMK
jgi:hypothetical protein